MNDSQSRGMAKVRGANRQLILQLLRQHPRSSRSDLARSANLSLSAVSSLVAELTASGSVREVTDPARRPGRGRPGGLLEVAEASRLVVAADIGDGHLRVAAVDMAGGVLLERVSPLTPVREPGEALQRVTSLVAEFTDEARADGHRLAHVVVSVPGAIDRETGIIVSDRLGRWEGMDLTGSVTAATGLTTDVENDADLAAVGESRFGAAAGLSDVVYVKASGGIGAGLVLNGRLYRGAAGGAGELGHVQVEERGRLCICGNRGCLETIASLGAVVDALRTVHPRTSTADDVTRLVAAGDRAAVRTVTDAGSVIGKAVADICNVLAPQAVVLGGDMTAGHPHFSSAVRHAVDRYTKPRTAARISVVTGTLGARASILGAVALAAERSPMS